MNLLFYFLSIFITI